MTNEKIKKAIIEAMRNKDEGAKDILRVALGEMQSVESREGSIDEEKCQKILRNILYSNQQNLDAYSSNMTLEQKSKIEKENEILEKFVTETLSKNSIIMSLHVSSDPSAGKAVIEEPNTGKAIGLAMKYFKKMGDSVDGKVVAEAVKEMKSDGYEFKLGE